MVKPSVVAIVPARGGSKSIPRKNIRRLGGIPLVAYSIEAGLGSHHVDRVVVSTDDAEIAAVATQFGAEVPFLRPPELSADTTPDLPVFDHALRWLETHDGFIPDVVVQLRPTSPLRPPSCVDAAIELLLADPLADSVRGVTVAAQNPFKMWRLQPDGTIAPLLATDQPEPYNAPRQTLPVCYWQTGHIDVVRTTTIRYKRSMTGTRVRALVVDNAYACDIDTEADWQRADWILAHFDRPLRRPKTRASLIPLDLRLIVFDFDGVMTDNRVWVGGDGQEWVVCNRSDGLGLSRLREQGLQILVLSSETHPVVLARCRKLGLDCTQGVSDKEAFLSNLIVSRGLSPAQVMYVGNDLNDLGCMRLVGCAVAVADAHPDLLSRADLVLSRRGGEGAVREVCDLVAARLAEPA